jgi:hypothetical protein
MEQLDSNAGIFRKFYSWAFLDNLTVITGTLHEDPRTFMTASGCNLRRVRNVSGKSCTENQNTFYIQPFLLPEGRAFMK